MIILYIAPNEMGYLLALATPSKGVKTVKKILHMDFIFIFMVTKIKRNLSYFPSYVLIEGETMLMLSVKG